MAPQSSHRSLQGPLGMVNVSQGATWEQLIQFRIDLFLFLLMQEPAQLQDGEKEETGNNKPAIKRERKWSLTFICNTHDLVGAGWNQTSVKCEPLDSPSAPAQSNIKLSREVFSQRLYLHRLPLVALIIAALLWGWPSCLCWEPRVMFVPPAAPNPKPQAKEAPSASPHQKSRATSSLSWFSHLSQKNNYEVKRGEIQLTFTYRDPKTKPQTFTRNDEFARIREFQRFQILCFPSQETFRHLTTGGDCRTPWVILIKTNK